MSKPTSMILGAALLAASSLAPRRAAAEGACIPATVTAALADCSAAASAPTVPVADVVAAAAQLQSPAGNGNLPAAGTRRKGPATSLARRDLDDAEKKLEGLFQRFLCVDKPAPGDARASAQHAEIEYALGRLYFNANHFAEAAVTFGDIALHRADTPVGIHATRLYLESLNVLGTPDTPSCYDDMARDVPLFLGLYCKDGKETANADQCGVMSMIQRDLLRLDAEKHVKEADRAGPDAAAAYEAGAVIYLQIWDRYGKAACEAKSAGCERMEEVLYNAARAYQGARRMDKSIVARQILIDPRYHLEHTDLAEKSVHEIGGIFHATAHYDEAATWYERYARESPAAEKSPEALLDSTVLRLGLGQVAQAQADADLYNKNYGSKRPGDSARVAFAMAMHRLEQADLPAAKRAFEGAMGQIDRNATIDVQIQAHAALGRTLAQLGKLPQAAAEYEKVRASFRDPAAVVQAIQRTFEGSLGDRALGKVLTAVGEAIYFFAEEKRRAAESIALPPFTGTGQRDDLLAYANGPMKTWLVARRAAISEAEKGYAAVLALQPMPPPRWVVPSAARVAGMHARLAAQIRAMPFPKAWKKAGPSPWGATWDEIRTTYRTALIEASDPMLARAKAANRSCVDYAARYQWFDESARGCAEWLTRHFPAEYPRIDEIVDRPTHRYYAIDREVPLGGVKFDP
jgi:tetratricopeptide (TPR) repeat protein